MITMNSRRQMQDIWYDSWNTVRKIMQTSDDKQAIDSAKMKGFKVNQDTLAANNGEMYDHNGKLMKKISTFRDLLNKSKNWTNKDNDGKCKYVKKGMLIIASLFFIVTGICVLLFTHRL